MYMHIHINVCAKPAFRIFIYLNGIENLLFPQQILGFHSFIINSQMKVIFNRKHRQCRDVKGNYISFDRKTDVLRAKGQPVSENSLST